MYKLGYTPRPYDPKSEKYRAEHLFRGLGIDPTTVVLNQPRSLANFGGRNCLVPISNQGQLGACAAFSSINATRVAAICQGWNLADVPALNYGLDYELSRMKEGGWPQDSGSDPADELTFLLSGFPLDSDMPYTALAGTDYRGVQGKDLHQYLSGFSSSNPNDPSFLGYMAGALDLGHPIVVAGNWVDQWMSADANGILPDLPVNVIKSATEGHAIYMYSRFRAGDGRWCWGFANQWTEQWNGQAVRSGLRAGDFAMSDAMLLAMCGEANIVVGANPATPKPSPTPNHYVAVGDCAPFWNFIQQYPMYFQTVFDQWGPFFHTRGCA